MFVFSNELKFNSSWKWQPSWSLKLVYLSQLTCSKNSLQHGTLLIYHPCHSLGFLDTKLTWFASSFSLSTLSMLTASKAAVFPKIDIPQAFHQVLSSGTPLPSSFLEKEAVSALTGWSLHLPPRGFRGPSQETTFHSCSSFLQGPVGAQQHQRSQRDGNSKSQALKTTLTLEPEVTKEEQSLNRVTAC